MSQVFDRQIGGVPRPVHLLELGTVGAELARVESSKFVELHEGEHARTQPRR